MRDVFIGSVSVRRGDVTAYQLRSRYRALYPDVYVPASAIDSLWPRTEGAWLWSGERATVAGLAAAALHGSQWIDDEEPVELIWRNTHPPDGLIVRNERVAPDEITRVAGIRVTTRAAPPTTSAGISTVTRRWRAWMP